MAGFEVIVRPAVFPDIRPAPAQPVPPADDPSQGFATIHGNGAKSISLSYSYSSSISSSQRSEIERRVDEARVYQKEADGKINKKNFVDIEAVNKVKMKGPPTQNNNPVFGGSFGGPSPMTGDDLSGYARIHDPEKNIIYFRKIGQADNIEILRENVIKTKDQPE